MFHLFAEVCTDGDIRLVGGTNPREGRVEVCYNEQYGTVCDLGFGTEEARVICGKLGFSRISESHNVWLNRTFV